LLLENTLMFAVANTSASVAEGPRTALRLDEPVETSPVVPEIENAAAVFASPPQTSPSEAVPHNDWLGRWKVSAAKVAPGGTVVVVVADPGTVVVVDGGGDPD
jgi:hypothetical protein